jgi:hypothetical protein
MGGGTPLGPALVPWLVADERGFSRSPADRQF